MQASAPVRRAGAGVGVLGARGGTGVATGRTGTVNEVPGASDGARLAVAIGPSSKREGDGEAGCSAPTAAADPLAGGPPAGRRQKLRLDERDQEREDPTTNEKDVEARADRRIHQPVHGLRMRSDPILIAGYPHQTGPKGPGPHSAKVVGGNSRSTRRRRRDH